MSFLTEYSVSVHNRLHLNPKQIVQYHTFIESHFVALYTIGGHGQQVATLPGDFIDEVTITG